MTKVTFKWSWWDCRCLQVSVISIDHGSSLGGTEPLCRLLTAAAKTEEEGVFVRRMLWTGSASLQRLLDLS